MLPVKLSVQNIQFFEKFLKEILHQQVEVHQQAVTLGLISFGFELY